MSNDESMDYSSDIAIVGMSGRFPGAANIKEFWRNLRDGVESITFFSDEELLAAGLAPELLTDPAYVAASGALSGIELFDASFFGFNPREAEILDPQQRLFLECAWESLEHAGYDPEKYKGLIGVYAGTSMSSYLFQVYSNPELVRMVGDFQVGLGNDKDNLTTLASYKLNLKGPSMAIQTACSTSLVAVSVACQSLLSYECDMALAGGVRVEVPQTVGYIYQEGGILSPDGHCRAFDAAARGTVGGNGIGIVVLKRLADARADGDHIYAIIKGTAVNNDGALKIGYTAPSVEGQAQVIAAAQAVAGIDPRTITYVEAHGTGTDLGDPIEVTALTQAFRAGTDEEGFCAIGSVKTNIGHLDTAAGVAGLIKVVQALNHGLIPPSLNFERPNPKIDFAGSPFYVNCQLSEWQTVGDAPRRAAVNSFGIGGTNAHVVVEEAPLPSPAHYSRSEHLLVLSAKTGPALEAASARLLEHLRNEREVNLGDVAYTLQVGRRGFNHRRALVCRDVGDAISQLETLDPKRVLTGGGKTSGRSVIFMFPGQGAQYVNMALGLYREEPAFRAVVDRCAELLKPHLGRDLREVLYPSGGATVEAAHALRQTSLAQPALFVIEYALATLWMEWGVRPDAMIGHSLGEYVAACLAGVLTLEDALALVAERGVLMQQLPAGAMLSVPLSERELEGLIDDELSIAAVNGPALSIASGPEDAVRRLEAKLAAQGLEGQRLHTSHAFHSGMMEPILASFTERIRSIKLAAPQMRYLSNLTGRWVTAAEATDPAYWAEHLRRTVRFADGVGQLLSEPDAILLEVGPGQTLSTLARLHPARTAGHVALPSLRHPADDQSDERFRLTTLSRLWLEGLPVDWARFHKGEKCRRTALPTYPFERRRYWVEPGPATDLGAGARSDVSLGKRPNVADWFYLPSWRRSAPPELYGQAESPDGARWLIFADECGVGEALAARLEQSGCACITVSAGERYMRKDGRSYEIDPRRRADYDALLEELQTGGLFPDKIAHLWSVSQNAPRGIDGFEVAQARGFYSLLYLAQALGERPTTATAPIQLGVVSNQVQSVLGDEELTPAKATILGASLVIPEEYQHLDCRSIDIVAPEPDSPGAATLVEQLIAEMMARTTDRLVAYRGGHRWVQDFENVRLQPAPSTPSTPRLREKGVYLITGGLGGIGLTLAEHLARTVRARLVLVGRSAFPEKQEWERRLAANGDGELSGKIRKLQEMERGGAEVMVASADVADLDAMNDVVARAAEKFGPVNGVIHAAGVAGGKMIQFQSPEVASQVLAPKALGALALDTIFRDEELDFFVLCSSLSSVLGALGQADYCGANAFLDAFAQQAASRGRSCVSINWDTWQEVGMAVNTFVPRDMEAARAESLQQGITPAEGVDVLSRILNTRLPQAAVSTTDLLALLSPPKPADESDLEAEDAWSEPVSTLHARPALANDYVAPRNDVEQMMANIWQDLLGVGQVGVGDNFFELGGHSLLAVQFISRIRGTFQVTLTLRHLFESPTISELAALVKESPSAREEHDRLEDVLKMVEQLSESEVRNLLAARSNLMEEGEHK